MANIYPFAYIENKFVPIEEATLNIASSAVLYGLSVYTVFPIVATERGMAVFRLEDHIERLRNSAAIIGIDIEKDFYTVKNLQPLIAELVSKNTIAEKAYVRATIHVTSLVPGTRSRGLATTLSMFAYKAVPIVPQAGVRLKTSVWRRVPDYAIPSRAKVNGAYVNSVLAKQDAIDSGYDDCILLDKDGHVCELSAANIWMVRNGVLITPPASSDILEGINRKTVFEIAAKVGIAALEREIDLTELYIADEVFVCGTSANVAPVIEIDKRSIPKGEITERIIAEYAKAFVDTDNTAYLTFL